MQHTLKLAVFGLSVILLSFSWVFSQEKALKSGVKGNIKESTGEPLEGVTVRIEGTSLGAYTDAEGKFQFELKPGDYQLKFSYVGFDDTLIPVKIVQNKITNLDFTFTEGGVSMTGVEIVAVRNTNTEVSVISDIKTLDKVANGVSAQQIQKMPDRNASEVIRRIPGITLQDNRFVLVRGLNERYNNVWLDRAMTPSSETDRRAFSFDIIPTQAIERIMIYKTASADIPADFAGAFIQVSTHNVPSEQSLTVNYTTGFRTGTTFQDFYQSERGSLDFLGMDDGTRALPSGLPKMIRNDGDIDYYNNINKKFANQWGFTTRSAFLDSRFNIVHNYILKSNKIKAGAVTVLSYSNSKQNFNIQRKDYSTDNITIFDFNDQQSIYQANTSLLHNWSFSFNPKFRLDIRNFFSMSGRDQTTIRLGKHFDAGSDIYGGMYYYLQRLTYTTQISGINTFNKESQKLDYAISYSLANRQEPDLRRFTATRPLNSPELEPYQVAVPQGTGSPTRAGRFYSQLHENIFTTAVNYSHPFSIPFFYGSKIQLKLKTGLYNEFRDRDFNARVFTYIIPSLSFDYDKLKLPISQIFAPENMQMPNGFRISEMTLPSDKYYSSFLISAGYLQTTWSWWKLELTAGIRAENTLRTLQSKKQDGSKVDTTLSQLNILPSTTLVFKMNEKNVIRGAYSQTLNRPEFREIVPFIFYDYDLNATILGSPNLKNATINNFDLRYEFYPSPADIVSLGVFYKDFKNPIEWIIQPGTGNLNRTFTFANAPVATSIGAEIEIKKSLDSWFDNYLKYFGVVFNASYIKNQVDLGELAVNQQQKRPMQGQSPYILNSGIFYQSDSTLGLQASLLYNIYGPRIFIVGDRDYPDIYEMQRHVVDASITKSFGNKWSIRLNIQDLLNQPFRFVQDFNKNQKLEPEKGDYTLIQWKRGTYFTLGINYKF